VTLRSAVRLFLLVGVMGAAGFLLSACQPNPHTFTVNTFVDGQDTHPGDGQCVSGADDKCSLQAAIEEGNASTVPVVIKVPAGTYPLTVGSLPIAPASGKMSIIGSGPGVVVQAPELPSVFEVGSGTDLLTSINADGAVNDVVAHSGANLSLLSFTAGGAEDHGLWVQHGSSVTATNATFADNDGSGVQADGSLSATFITVTTNGAGGITGSGSVSLSGSIVANQTSGANCQNPATSSGYNLSSDATCGLTATGDLQSTPALLSGPAGPLSVHAPQLGSPAIDLVPTSAPRAPPPRRTRSGHSVRRAVAVTRVPSRPTPLR
jgi:hypothetical protein